MSLWASRSISSRNLLIGSLAAGLFICAIVECISQVTAPPADAPTSTPTGTPLPQCADNASQSIEDRIREAFQETDPYVRQGAVLCSVERFLRAEAVNAMTDEQASAYLTSTAFSSEHLTLADPALVVRENAQAIVGLPDGMGLYLYDLSAPAGSFPLAISPWTIGLSHVQISSDEMEIGVSFETVDQQAAAHIHYALITRDGTTWRVSWLSDDHPDWWFNSRNAALSVAPDRSRLIVVGEARNSTLVFDEKEGRPHRLFRLEWIREGHAYRLKLSPGGYPSRSAWQWEIAQPSPYATLVEFVERIQMGDSDGAARLVTNPNVISDAMAFGLYLAGRQFEVLSSEPQRIVFRDRQGTFVADFLATPSNSGPVWRIASLAPLGAEP